MTRKKHQQVVAENALAGVINELQENDFVVTTWTEGDAVRVIGERMGVIVKACYDLSMPGSLSNWDGSK